MPFAVVLVVGALLGVVRARANRAPSDKPSWRQRRRLKAFQKKFKGRAGESPATAVSIDSLSAAAKAFTGSQCANGHAWGAAPKPDGSVMFGGEQIQVVVRRCDTCGSAEHLYFKLLS